MQLFDAVNRPFANQYAAVLGPIQGIVPKLTTPTDLYNNYKLVPRCTNNAYYSGTYLTLKHLKSTLS